MFNKVWKRNVLKVWSRKKWRRVAERSKMQLITVRRLSSRWRMWVDVVLDDVRDVTCPLLTHVRWRLPCWSTWGDVARDDIRERTWPVWTYARRRGLQSRCTWSDARKLILLELRNRLHFLVRIIFAINSLLKSQVVEYESLKYSRSCCGNENFLVAFKINVLVLTVKWPKSQWNASDVGFVDIKCYYVTPKKVISQGKVSFFCHFGERMPKAQVILSYA